jgi:hypothetical protein
MKIKEVVIAVITATSTHTHRLRLRKMMDESSVSSVRNELVKTPLAGPIRSQTISSSVTLILKRKCYLIGCAPCGTPFCLDLWDKTVF